MSGGLKVKTVDQNQDKTKEKSIIFPWPSSTEQLSCASYQQLGRKVRPSQIIKKQEQTKQRTYRYKYQNSYR